jgi:hypothetical protein
MRRREFITLLGGTAIAWPLAALHRTCPLLGLKKEAGFVDGQNVAIDYRWGNPKRTSPG